MKADAAAIFPGTAAFDAGDYAAERIFPSIVERDSLAHKLLGSRSPWWWRSTPAPPTSRSNARDVVELDRRNAAYLNKSSVSLTASRATCAPRSRPSAGR